MFFLSLSFSKKNASLSEPSISYVHLDLFLDDDDVAFLFFLFQEGVCVCVCHRKLHREKMLR